MSTLEEIAGRFKELVDKRAVHDPAMHEGTRHCEGCERAHLVRMIKQLIDTEDDTVVQNTKELRGKSRKEHTEAQVGKQWQAHKAQAQERAKKERGP